MSWGDHRRLHYTEAVAEAEANGELLVTTDNVLIINQGKESAVAIHIVAEPNFWESDEPKGYGVQLVRSRWLYGSEGILFPLRWVCYVEDLTSEELDAIAEDDPVWEALPEGGNYLWALPKMDWKRCEIAWWDSFRRQTEAAS